MDVANENQPEAPKPNPVVAIDEVKAILEKEAVIINHFYAAPGIGFVRITCAEQMMFVDPADGTAKELKCARFTMALTGEALMKLEQLLTSIRLQLTNQALAQMPPAAPKVEREPLH